MKVRAIEVGREVPRGGIEKQDDLEWEGYLQIHNHAERTGLLSHDEGLHNYLDAKLAVFETKYGDPTT